MIKILKASAGSGKTFSLAKEYISLLLGSGDPYAYRHILAVTFTNKATDEMKQRILKELDVLASDPAASNYIDDIVAGSGKSTGEISALSRKLLFNVLNDYSAFSVSTIDHFFQRTLKAFSREIGQFASYQVELDKNSLVTESVDRILDALTEDNSALLSWLTESVSEQLLKNGKFSLDKELYETAIAMKSEEHRELVERYGIDEDNACSKSVLAGLKKGCAAIVNDFQTEVRDAAKAVKAAMGNVNADDFNGKFMKAVDGYADKPDGEPVARPTDAFMKKAADKELWFAKTKAASLLPLVDGKLDAPLDKFISLFGWRYKEYRTAQILQAQIYSLGLSREINDSFNDLKREKNVLSLDDSNTILKGIIDGSDTPFIYEKIGVRYDHFLLDEFQDTSNIQWENFRPLIADSDAAGNGNLIVGDVKQSIYRWRNSDWNLLNAKLKAQFPQAVEKPLDSNWRSVRNVVEFNNGFYRYAAGCLDAMTGDDTVSRIYADVAQKVKAKDPASGNVDVLFCDKDADTDTQLHAVIREVRRLKGTGARNSDIGILVRTNGIGGIIAAELMRNDIPVISDDSLDVKSSPAVRRLAALLSYANNPADSLNSYLAMSLGIEPPSEYHSLVDLCEYFIREMKEGLETGFEGEKPYLQAFMDVVQDWSQVYGNSLQDFITYWDAANPKISSPDDADAVRIITIHKSKGLAFPYVIFPYADKIPLYRNDVHWCRPEVEGSALEPVASGIYRVNLSADIDDSLFSESYRAEWMMQMVDALNLFYVTTTRAEKGMTIISELPAKTCCSSVAEGASYKFSKMSQILYWYTHLPSSGGFMKEIAPGEESEDLHYFEQRFRMGVPYEFKRDNQEDTAPETENTPYQSFPMNPEEGKARLKFSTEAADFFSPEGRTGIEASGRLKGIVLHDILSKVAVPEDLDKALEDSFGDGSIDEEEKAEIGSMLAERIASAKSRGWFPDSREAVFNETSIIDADGEVYRPDRVIIDGGRVTVVDYKFGHHLKKYEKQISKYAELYRAMGYEDVSASLWYVAEDEVVTVISD